MDFKLWLEASGDQPTADFGFDKEEVANPHSIASIEREHPIHRFDIEEMGTYLAMRKLGGFLPCKVQYVNQYVWGENVGAVRIRINTGLQLLVDRKGVDLLGNERWLAKKSFQINREGYGGYEDVVAGEIFEVVKEVHSLPLDVPAEDWPNLERTVVNLANKLQRTAKEILVFENITKINSSRYIIVFGVRGHGVAAQDHRRVEQNITEVIFDEHSGALRIFNTNVESDVGGRHGWELMPNDQDFFFFHTQDNEEISEVVSTPMKFY